MLPPSLQLCFFDPGLMLNLFYFISLPPFQSVTRIVGIQQILLNRVECIFSFSKLILMPASSQYLKLLLMLYYLHQRLEQSCADNPKSLTLGFGVHRGFSFFQQTDLPSKLYFIVPVLQVVPRPPPPPRVCKNCSDEGSSAFG